MMRDLSGFSGDALDEAFLRDMIPHHMVAVMASQQLLVHGRVEHAEITDFAPGRLVRGWLADAVWGRARRNDGLVAVLPASARDIAGRSATLGATRIADARGKRPMRDTERGRAMMGAMRGVIARGGSRKSGESLLLRYLGAAFYDARAQ